jgi:hypothetical protein
MGSAGAGISAARGAGDIGTGAGTGAGTGTGPGADIAAVTAGTGAAAFRVTYTYHPMNPVVIANTSRPSRSQNTGVSAGSARRGAAFSSGTCARGRSALAVSSAEGPEATKAGKRLAHPMQNMAVARFERPQAAQAIVRGPPARVLDCAPLSSAMLRLPEVRLAGWWTALARPFVIKP